MKTLSCKSFIISFLLCFSFFSCGVKTDDTIKLDSGWKYALQNPDIEETELRLLNDVDLNNLQELIPSGTGTIYLTKKFLLPDSLKKKDISCFLGRISYSDRTYLNHYLIGSTGFNEEHRYSSGRESRFYEIPEELLLPELNTITIEIYVQNKGFLRSNAFISYHDRAKAAWLSDCFWNSHLYLILACILIFLGLYSSRIFHRISAKKDVFFYYIMCFLTALNLSIYFIAQLPLFDFYKHNYVFFEKLNSYLVPAVILFVFTLFIDEFFDRKASGLHIILRAVIFVIPQLIYFAVPYRYANGIVSIIPYGAFVPGMLYIIFVFCQELSRSKRNSFKLAMCVSPSICFVLLDVFFHVGLNLNFMPYLTLLGWPFSLIASIFLISNKKITELKEEISTAVVPVRKADAYVENNVSSQPVVVPPPAELPEKQEYAVSPAVELDNYEIAGCSVASTKSKGYMYECFMDSSLLHGIAMVEVTKADDAADTMLENAKRIVSDRFNDGKDIPLTKVMQNINTGLLSEKGEGDVSYTGMLLRVFDNRIEYVNVGHSPAIYRNERGTKCMPVLINSANYAVQANGVLGIEEVSSDYRGIGFTVSSGDAVIIYSALFETARNLQGEAFGQDRIRQAFLQSPAGSAEEKLNYIMTMFQNFTHDVPVEQGLTVVVIQKK